MLPLLSLCVSLRFIIARIRCTDISGILMRNERDVRRTLGFINSSQICNARRDSIKQAVPTHVVHLPSALSRARLARSRSRKYYRYSLRQ